MNIRPAASPRWDNHFLALAAQAATMSKDPSTQVGAVAVLDRRVLAMGFNGFPPGMDDDPLRLNDRSVKYPRMVHAEENVVAFAASYGVALKGATLYVHPFQPCSRCAKLIAAVGFFEVVVPSMTVPERWQADTDLAREILNEVGVGLRVAAPGLRSARPPMETQPAS